MQQLTVGQVALIKEIALNNGFNELEIRTSAGSRKGDNYMGVIISVTFRDGTSTFDLILKTSHTNEDFRRAACLKNVFIREIYVYDKVFPEIEQFQKEYQLAHPFESYPKFYGSHLEANTECLVLEDLRKLGYSMCDRKNDMNKAHIKKVLEEYAKLHSVSLAMRYTKEEMYNKIKKNMSDVYAEGYLKDDTSLVAYTDHVLSKALRIVEGNPTATRLIEEIRPKMASYYKYELLDPEYLSVFVHGDCWCNNLMFIYEDEADNSTPKAVQILDWQMSKCSSPALDLVYFLFCQGTKEILDNYKYYLRHYYNIFANNLKSVGCDPEIVFPFSKLERHFKKFAKFGLITATLAIGVILCDANDAPDLGSTTDGDLTKILDINSSGSKKANQRIKDLVHFMIDNDMF